MEGQPVATQSPYQELLVELDRQVQVIKQAAFALKKAAPGVQAVERNVDRILASAKMLEINVGDALGTERTMASWTEDDRVL